MKLGIAALVVWLCVIAAVVIGWIMNIVTLVGLDWSNDLTIEVGLRIVGLFAVPLGAVMGYI